jgi:hypothetical protein
MRSDEHDLIEADSVSSEHHAGGALSLDHALDADRQCDLGLGVALCVR